MRVPKLTPISVPTQTGSLQKHTSHGLLLMPWRRHLVNLSLILEMLLEMLLKMLLQWRRF